MNGSHSFFGDLREIGRELVMYTELLRELTFRDLRIRYKQAIMGVAWAVLTPVVVALSGALVWLAVGQLSHAPVDRRVIAGIMVKSLGWSFFAGALGFGTASVTGNIALITKVYFAREVLPLAAVFTQLVDTTIAAAVTAVLLFVLGVGLSPNVFWLLLLVPLLLLLTTGVTLLFACLNVLFRDAKHLVQLVLSFGIFFTPVFFEPSMFGPRAARVLMLNPLSPVLEGVRLAVVQGHNLLTPLVAANGAPAWEPWYLVYTATWALLGLTFSAVVFHRSEFVFAEYV
jgi:ABC-type polysaccharide/polyol phosphate export permease